VRGQSRSPGSGPKKLYFIGTGTKRKTLPGPEKNYRDRYQRLNPRLYDGLNSVNFCTSEITLFEKKEPKSATRRLNKLKKRVLKNFLDEILNYRSAGPLSVPVPVVRTGTGTKRKILAGPEPGPKKKLPGPGPKKVGPAHVYSGQRPRWNEN